MGLPDFSLAAEVGSGSLARARRCSPLHDIPTRIADLELEIERLTEAAERCRKIGIAAKALTALGGLVLLGLLIGVLRFSPEILVTVLAALVGGVALMGSNQGTADEVRDQLKAAVTRRSELIDALHLTAVDPVPS